MNEAKAITSSDSRRSPGRVIIDARTYACYPGKLPEFLAIYTSAGMPIQWPILGEPLAILTTDVGTLNEVVFWWRYDDSGDRDRRRSQLAAAPGWQSYLEVALPLLRTQSNCILHPTALSRLI